MPALDDLLAFSYDGRSPALDAEVQGWLRESRRFRDFVTRYQDKIRAKLRTVRDPEGMKDLRAELEAAALLLGEEQFSVEYETYAAAKQRGPDFTVTFRTHTRFNVEVRRVRAADLLDARPDQRAAKIMAVLCDKVGQMPPSIVNLLWLAAEPPLLIEDVAHAAATLHRMAGEKAEGYFARHGFTGAAAFLKQSSRLSGIALRRPHELHLWLNPLARHKLPPRIAATLQRLDAV